MGQTSISTGSNYSFRIGKRWDNGQRFVGAIDDVRLYSKGFSLFEIQQLVREGAGLPVDVGKRVIQFQFGLSLRSFPRLWTINLPWGGTKELG